MSDVTRPSRKISQADIKAVEVRAELRQVKSMVDHTFNVVLNVPEDNIEQVKVLLGWLGEEIRMVMARVAK